MGVFLTESDKERYLQMCNISGIPAIILELSFYFPKKIEMSDSTCMVLSLLLNKIPYIRREEYSFKKSHKKSNLS